MQSLGIEQIQPSVMEETFNNVGDGFQEILNQMDKINTNQTITTVDTLALQQSMFHYTMFQEIVTKVASKSASAINEVMKAQ
ncbi:EscI/YscI/HrpB family type III secretion system inner rod protein [Vibrio splendidus]|uniref:EscI/YscI/HrpB family type III secretion system inner rod protein n=1 Tax=Vibrio splendidus TaxID=29497 RepID=A0A2N7CHI6_VIBSP|nr:EscI/YscI/HrpB family type III secretion system inner rod protein [Vibrio splendidus]PMF25611.1 EscI/YscI/HrpB family type III secretion system inner rod protein [Vibrio splendidus]